MRLVGVWQSDDHKIIITMDSEDGGVLKGSFTDGTSTYPLHGYTKTSFVGWVVMFPDGVRSWAGKLVPDSEPMTIQAFSTSDNGGVEPLAVRSRPAP